jgi:hypothetical protein
MFIVFSMCIVYYFCSLSTPRVHHESVYVRWVFTAPDLKLKGEGNPQATGSTVLTVGVIQMRTDCRDFCTTTPGSCISYQDHPHPPGFVYRLYIPGLGWGPWELARKQLQGMIGARPTGPPPSDGVIVGISRHHSSPLAFPWHSRAPLPSILFREDARSWEIPPPAAPPSGWSSGGRTACILFICFIYII